MCVFSSGIVLGIASQRWHLSGRDRISLATWGSSRDTFPSTSILLMNSEKYLILVFNSWTWYKNCKRLDWAQFTFKRYEKFRGKWIPMLFRLQCRRIEVGRYDMQVNMLHTWLRMESNFELIQLSTINLDHILCQQIHLFQQIQVTFRQL